MHIRRFASALPFLSTLGLGGCLESGAPVRNTGPGVEIKVAPLDLPGIGFACYDVEVRNGLGFPVWSRGNPALSFPTDTDTLCSTRFGNGPGGDISYVGPCDFDEPAHQVSLVLDGLHDVNGNALGDYQNPCQADNPCVLDVVCAENADTPVTFNLTVMRAAKQGFFDIAVNFDDIFCSAKVDCTYDDAGNQPIELLFDPATGERTQTAVVAVACTAGPGENVDTTLLMNDIRIQCGDAVPPQTAYNLFSCDDAGTMFIGIHQAFSASGFEFASADWTRQADGSYTPALAAVNPFDPVLGTVGLPLQVIGQTTDGSGNLVTTALGVTTTLDVTQNPPFSQMRSVFFRRTGLGAWDLVGVVGIHPDDPAGANTIMFPYDSPLDEYIVTRNQLDGNTVNPFVTLAFPPPSGLNYSTTWNLRRPADYNGECDSEIHTGTKYVLMSCKHAVTGNWDLLAWDITASPLNNPGPGLDAIVMPLAPANFTFAGGVTATGIDGFYGIGTVSGNNPGNDRILATAEVRMTDGTNTLYGHQLVHFRRGAGTWLLEAAPFGQDGGPLHGLPNTWFNNNQTYVRQAIQRGSGITQDVVQGGHFFGGTWRQFVARYNSAANTWAVTNDFETAPGVDIAGISFESGLFGSAANYYLAGAGQAAPAAPVRPFIARIDGTTPNPSQVIWLPMPSAPGWTFDRMNGTYGDTRFTATTRRLSGNIVDSAGTRHVIEWRFDIDAGGQLVLQSWYIYTPNETVDDDPNDWLSLRDGTEGDGLGPRHAPMTQRCSQVLERYDAGTPQNPLERGIIFDPSLDGAGGLAAVDQVVTLAPTVGAIDGTLFVRDPVVDTSALTALQTSGDFTMLDPSQAQEGNVWTSTNPKPADVPAHILQYASYFGDEALTCNGEPCNKVFWNTAIAFDPTVPGCTLAFEATAAQTSSLVNGQIPANASWPLIVARVPLTSTPDGDPAGPVEMICRRNPLDSDAFQTIYKPQRFDFPFCHTLGPSGGPPVASNLSCGYTAETYLSMDKAFGRGNETAPIGQGTGRAAAR